MLIQSYVGYLLFYSENVFPPTPGDTIGELMLTVSGELLASALRLALSQRLGRKGEISRQMVAYVWKMNNSEQKGG